MEEIKLEHKEIITQIKENKYLMIEINKEIEENNKIIDQNHKYYIEKNEKEYENAKKNINKQIQRMEKDNENNLHLHIESRIQLDDVFINLPKYIKNLLDKKNIKNKYMLIFYIYPDLLKVLNIKNHYKEKINENNELTNFTQITDDYNIVLDILSKINTLEENELKEIGLTKIDDIEQHFKNNNIDTQLIDDIKDKFIFYDWTNFIKKMKEENKNNKKEINYFILRFYEDKINQSNIKNKENFLKEVENLSNKIEEQNIENKKDIEEKIKEQKKETEKKIFNEYSSKIREENLLLELKNTYYIPIQKEVINENIYNFHDNKYNNSTNLVFLFSEDKFSIIPIDYIIKNISNADNIYYDKYYIKYVYLHKNYYKYEDVLNILLSEQRIFNIIYNNIKKLIKYNDLISDNENFYERNIGNFVLCEGENCIISNKYN